MAKLLTVDDNSASLINLTHIRKAIADNCSISYYEIFEQLKIKALKKLVTGA
jgi:hypothetical protein